MKLWESLYSYKSIGGSVKASVKTENCKILYQKAEFSVLLREKKKVLKNISKHKLHDAPSVRQSKPLQAKTGTDKVSDVLGKSILQL